MPLYIRDDDVDTLASQLQALIGVRTKTEAVRRALTHEIARAREDLPLAERLAAAKAKAREIGPSRKDFDMKRFSDDLWGG
jgi:antitoxin VapB